MLLSHSSERQRTPGITARWSGTLISVYLPVPVRLDVCGLLLALSLALSCPVLVPVAVGVNVTLIVHLPLAARLVVQVVAEIAKSPVVEIASPVRDTF